MPTYVLIAVVAVGLILAFVALVASRPAAFRIERSAEIAAPRDVVFGIVNNLRLWGRWSPWEHLDPDMKKTFEGPAAGPGSVTAWDGNKRVGAGRMTILDSKPVERVDLKLEFFRPFACNNDVAFTLSPAGKGTRIVWSMEGTNTFMSKAFSMFCNMDKMVGKDFEKGLANLNVIAQAEAEQAVS